MADDALDLSAEVVELSLIEGERRVSPPEMGSIEGERGRLYVLVEVSAPAELWDIASERLVKAATEAFRKARGGITGALNAAAEAANALLLQENANAMPDQQIWAGLNCVVMRGSDLYLGQAGPALTYIARNAAVTRFPRSFDDLQTGDAPALTPLGESYAVQVRLAHFTLKPHDVVALTASHLPTLAPPDAIEAALTSESAQDAAGSLADLAQGQDFSAMVIRVGEQTGRRTVATAPGPSIRESARRRRGEPRGLSSSERERDAWWYGETEPTTPVEPAAPPPDKVSAEPPAPPPASRPRQEVEPEPRPHRPTRRSRLEPASQVGSPDEPKALPTPRRLDRIAERAPTRRPARGSLLGALRIGVATIYAILAMAVGAIIATLRWSQRALGPLVQRTGPLLDSVGQLFVGAIATVWRFLQSLLYQLLPGGEVPPPRKPGATSAQRDGPPRDRRALWLLAAVGLPLLALTLTAFLVWRQGSTRNSAYNEHAAAAQAYLEQAQAAPTAEAAQLVQQAQAEIEAAETIQPNSVELRQMRERAQDMLDRTLNIIRLTPTRLAALSESAQPVNIAVAGDDVYALDLHEGAIYRLSATRPVDGSLASQSPVVYGGQQATNGTLGTPQFLTWMPKGNDREAALIVLTASGQVAEFDPAANTVRILPFTPVDARVVAIEPYFGNLYLLDREHKQVWKYVPDGSGGYSNPPSSWITAEASAELGPPLQMGIDGDIYILQDQGKVSRLNSGKLRDFSLPAIEPPLTSPLVLATEPPESTDLFLADGERVLRFSKRGELLAQYLPPANESWGTIRDLAVDTNAGALYLLTTGGVYRLPYTSATPLPTPSNGG
ncbi:MAG TPA: hypothetical protein DEP84_37520 [Chloroflexi bacterium]|nr:hypothetical protein [Chloroflexota bacterium]